MNKRIKRIMRVMMIMTIMRFMMRVTIFIQTTTCTLMNMRINMTGTILKERTTAYIVLATKSINWTTTTHKEDKEEKEEEEMEED